jgi:MscS family membrane protein
VELAAFVEWTGRVDLPAVGAVLGGAVVLALAVYVLFDRVGRHLVRRTTTELDDLVVDRFRLPLAGTVVLVGVWYALAHLALPERFGFAATGALLSVGVIGWTISLAGTASRLLDWVVRNRERYATVVTNRTLPVFDLAAKVFLWGGSAYFLLLAWGVDVSAWLASAGIVGVALGFASQDTLANLVSGVFILADAPYKLGDWVVLDSGERGQVVEIGMRTTRLRTRDDVIVILPNKVMAGARIQNQSTAGEDGVRVRVKVTVAYGTELPAVHAALVALAAEVPGVAPSPEPRIRLRALGVSGLEHELMFWVRDPSTVGLASHLVLCAAYDRLRALGVEIPYPQLDVRTRS